MFLDDFEDILVYEDMQSNGFAKPSDGVLPSWAADYRAQATPS